MNKEEFIKFLKDNLTITHEYTHGSYGECDQVKLELKLNNETISETEFDVAETI